MGDCGRPHPARASGPALRGRGLRCACLASALVALSGSAYAERLPLTSFTTKDGLASDRILCIVPDSRGFLWLCHNGQLSRFDGERFVRYGPEHGLPSGPIRDLLETSRGDYLVGTAAGVYRFDPRGGERLFAPLAAPGEQAPSVVALLEDRQARLWAGTTTGFYEVLAAPGAASPRHRRIDLPGDANLPTSGTYEIVQERDGDLWLATEHGVVRRAPSGEMALFSTRDGLPGDDVRALVLDPTDALWAGTTMGIARLDPGAVERGEPLVADVIRPGANLPQRFVSALFASSDGTVWAGALALGALRPERRAPPRFRWYTTAQRTVAERRHLLRRGPGRQPLDRDRRRRRDAPDARRLRRLRRGRGDGPASHRLALRDERRARVCRHPVHALLLRRRALRLRAAAVPPGGRRLGLVPMGAAGPRRRLVDPDALGAAALQGSPRPAGPCPRALHHALRRSAHARGLQRLPALRGLAGRPLDRHDLDRAALAALPLGPRERGAPPFPAGERTVDRSPDRVS